MNWPLQENFLDSKLRKKLSNFIQNNDRLTQSKKVSLFEKKFAIWNGSKFAIYVNSGSSANLLIVQSAKELLNWKDGDEILVPSVTWPTTITPIIQSNLKPVFIDININDFSFNYALLNKKITKRTKAIFVAHIIGYPANFSKLKKIMNKKKITILEDCCESQGAKFNKKKIGNFGIAGSFSFYWGHHMSTIEGGMITTNDKNFYHLCLLKRSHGLARELPKNLHFKIKQKYKCINFKFLFLTDGFNLRNTEINAFIGIEMLKKIDQFIKKRNKNFSNFIKICSKYKKFLHIPNFNENISSFVLPFIFKDKTIKKRVELEFSKNNIEFRPFIAGNLLRQPFLKNYQEINMKNSDLLHFNANYIGNNQFVDSSRIKKLDQILKKVLI